MRTIESYPYDPAIEVRRIGGSVEIRHPGECWRTPDGPELACAMADRHLAACHVEGYLAAQRQAPEVAQRDQSDRAAAITARITQLEELAAGALAGHLGAACQEAARDITSGGQRMDPRTLAHLANTLRRIRMGR